MKTLKEKIIRVEDNLVIDTKYVEEAVLEFDNYLHSIRHDDYFDIQDTRKKLKEIFGDWEE